MQNWRQLSLRPSLTSIPVYMQWDPGGAEECVCKFLCSDFPALPLAITGSSHRAGAQGTSRAGGQLTLAAARTPHTLPPGISVPSSALCLLKTKNERGLDPRLFRDLPTASTPSGCVPACIPAIWQSSPAGPVHPPACLGCGSGSRQVFSPRHPLGDPERGVSGSPSALRVGGQVPQSPVGLQGPSQRGSSTDLPLLRVFSHV